MAIGAPIGAAIGASFYTVPASQTPEGKERLQAYYAEMGRFVDMFARVETTLTYTLRHYAKTDEKTAKIVFAGTRVENATKYIKQLADAMGADHATRADLDDVLQQLGIINSNRNLILHYGTDAESVAEGNAFVSDAIKAKGEPNKFPISPDILEAMTADLRKIAFHLNYRHLGRQMPRSEMGVETLNGVLHAPWRYRHPTQPKSQTKEGARRQSRKRSPK